MARQDLNRYSLIDGVKSIPLNQLPEEAWTRRGGGSDTSDIAKHYAAVAFLYRCVEIRANAVMGLPWRITRGESEVWSSENVKDVPPQLSAVRLLPLLLWQTEMSMCLRNQAFWFKERNRARVLDVRWMKASSVTPIWDEIDGLVGYERRLANGIPIRYELDDIVWTWLRGEEETEPRPSPAQAALTAAGVLFNVDAFEKQFFERGAIKATLLTVPGTTQPAERERLEQWWNRFFGGISKAFTQKVINADAVVPVVVGEGIQELSNTALTAEKREDIATAMGVQHSLVLSNAANYATSQQDELNFYNQTIVPDAQQIEWQINEQLFDGMGYRFNFAPDELSIFQEDEEQRSASLLNLVQAGIPLPIAAEILGINLPDGVEYADLMPPEPEPVPQQLQPVTVQEEREPEPVIEGTQQAQKAAADDDRKTVELATFRRWLKKSPARAERLDGFKSDILTEGEKAAIAAELTWEDADGDDAPFPVPDWTDYP